jgi:hypothetical protein
MRRGKQHFAGSGATKTLCGLSFDRFLNVRDSDFEEYCQAHPEDCKTCKARWWPEPRINNQPTTLVLGLVRLT